MKRPRGRSRGGPRRGGGGRRVHAAGELTRDRVLGAIARASSGGLSARALLGRLGGHRHHSRQLKSLLRALESERRIERVGPRYRLVRADGLVEGRRTTAGAVVDARGRTWDVSGSLAASPEAPSAGAERVLIQPVGDPAEGRAEVVGPVVAERDAWVGLFRRAGRGGVVVPYRDDADWTLAVAPGDLGGARPGEVVAAVAVNRDRGGRRPPRARVVERLGVPGDPEADFRAVVWHRQIPVAFPEAALEEAAAAVSEIGDEERAARADLSHLPFVTIDPVRARDHDDAVCVERTSRGLRLWVAIADVSHFVREGSALDREALRRGNSVYLPDRAIPMLPERLSSDLCSLVPDAERRVLAVSIDFDAEARARGTRFHWGLVRSRARLVYEDAAAAMEGADTGMDADRASDLRALAELTRRLRRRRMAEGSLDFQLPEVEVVVDESGRAVDVVECASSGAHRAIEEAMLAANRAVGEALRKEARPAIYRLHEAPEPADLAELGDRLAFLGLWKPNRGRRARAPLEPRRLSRILARAADPARARIAHGWALRAMKQARYGVTPKGHFALAFDTYLHFTSPIRRYADLAVHRALVDRMASLPVAGLSREREKLERVAAHLGHRERRAVQAERDASALWRLEWLSSRVGETGAGIIQSIGRAGLWVRLADWPVEGLVPARHVPGRYEVDPLALRALDPAGRTRMAVGDRVRVRIEKLDRARGNVELRLLEHESSRPQVSSPSSSSSSARRSHSR
ncbi:MAG: ribonuclease R family protein [Myxococcota bacterium]